jgi:Flp pilus assembly protein TadG
MKFRFFRNQDGAAAIEFGLVAPILAAVLMGVAGFGGMILAYNKMRQAISSGAQYALTVSEDPEEVEDVVIAAWEGAPVVKTVTVTPACFCAGVTNSCSVLCSNGDYPQKITTIHASMTYRGLAGDRGISAEQQVRTR